MKTRLLKTSDGYMSGVCEIPTIAYERQGDQVFPSLVGNYAEGLSFHDLTNSSRNGVFSPLLFCFSYFLFDAFGV